MLLIKNIFYITLYKMFIIILILCLFVAVLIYGFFTIRKLNRQIEDFQAQADHIDALSERVNAITSRIDCLAIGNEDTQEKHFDVDSNSLMLMNGYGNRFLHHPNHDEITSDDNEADEKEQEQKEEQIKTEIKPEIKPEIKEDFKQENKKIDEQPKIVEKNDQQDNKPINDIKSNDSINFKKILDLDNDDINKFDIEINDKGINNKNKEDLNNEIKEINDEQELNKEINDEQNFFLESKEDVQQDLFNDKNDDITDENNDNQSDNNIDDDKLQSESNDETNNEISVDYTIIKKYIETHPFNGKVKLTDMKQLILDSHIDIIEPSILTMKREDMYNKLNDLVKNK